MSIAMQGMSSVAAWRPARTRWHAAWMYLLVGVLTATLVGPSEAAQRDRDRGAESSSAQAIGRVTVARGRVTATNPAGRTRRLARRAPVFEGDTIKTGARGRVQIRFKDGARLALRPRTEMSLDEYKFEEAAPQRDRSRLSLRRGGFRTVTGRIGHRSRSRYRVNTPFAQIGVRGTDWGASAEDIVVVGVSEGATDVSNDAGSVTIGPDYDFAYAVVEAQDMPPIAVAEPPIDPGSFMGMELDSSDQDQGDEGDEASAAQGEEEEGAEGEEEGGEEGADGDGGEEGAGGETEAAAGGGEDEGGMIEEIETEIDFGGEGDEEGSMFDYDVRCL